MTEEDLAEFLGEAIDPAAILSVADPSVYPACARCHQAYMLRRNRGVWAWHPDCHHKAAGVTMMRS